MEESFISPLELLKASTGSVALDEKMLMATSKYATQLGEAVEDSVNPETIIYLLKNQLVDTAISNHNMKRVISLLIWRLNAERATTSIKSEMGSAMQKTIDSLELLMSKSSEKRQAWKQRLEKLDYDISCLKQQLESWHSGGGDLLGTLTMVGKPRLRKPINKRAFNRQGTWRMPDSSGRCASRLFSPRRSPQRQMSGLDFSGAMEQSTHVVSSFKDALKATAEPPKGTDTPAKDVPHVAMEQIKLIPPPVSAGNFGEPELVATRIRPEFTDMNAAGDREEAEKLERNLHEVQIELAWHKALSDLLMEELGKTREKADVLRGQVAEIKESAEQAVKDENDNWRMTTENLKVNYDKELTRKQSEISQLHNQLAQWIMKYMELEKGVPSSVSLRSLLNEYGNRNDSCRTLRSSTPTAIMLARTAGTRKQI